ncbi:class I SAM-dependent methyltransferase [Calothrix sp. CCY 0018]|uniref:class I SAM-dependent methyltransferase n=1 Tax=Calothrix sp. CCY 0018 TaxID=3103864 RepID=UPI0039C7619D
MNNSQYEKQYKQQVTDFFNQRTKYDDDFRFRLALALVDLVQLQKGQKILDVATGTGIVAMAAAEIIGNQGKVVGVDISSTMLNQAREKIEQAGLQNIELIEADADYVNFEDKSFDAIFCSSAFVWLSDIPNNLQKWYRFLNKGGALAFSCFSETSFMTPIIIQACEAACGISLPNINAPLGTPEKCRDLLQKVGFQRISITTQQFGSYISLNDAKSWNGNWFHPRSNPLKELSQIELKHCKAEYEAAIENLATDKGVWNDKTTFFVVAHKD